MEEKLKEGKRNKLNPRTCTVTWLQSHLLQAENGPLQVTEVGRLEGQAENVPGIPQVQQLYPQDNRLQGTTLYTCTCTYVCTKKIKIKRRILMDKGGRKRERERGGNEGRKGEGKGEKE